MTLRAPRERPTGGRVPAHREAALPSPWRLLLPVALAAALALFATSALGRGVGARAVPERLGALAINLLLIGGAGAALRQLRREVFDQSAALALFETLVGVAILGASVAARITPGAVELVPVPFVAIVVSALFDRQIGRAHV